MGTLQSPVGPFARVARTKRAVCFGYKKLIVSGMHLMISDGNVCNVHQEGTRELYCTVTLHLHVSESQCLQLTATAASGHFLLVAPTWSKNVQ